MTELNSESEVLKIVVVGHVDHGKSTLIGRLLYDTDSLPEGTVNKVRRIAKETGKPFEYAYLLDAFEEEQQQGITIDTTQIQFQSKKRGYVIIDAPGHKEFLKNMISGAANAEAALLVIDANEGVREQSKRHAYILSLLGISRAYVVLNKMDLVDYSQAVFENVTGEMGEFLGSLNVQPIGYIPVSSYYGENITTKSEKLSWYSGQTVIEAIDSIEKEKGLERRPLRFPIQDVYKFDDRRIIAGRIESGSLKAGDEITIYPEGKKTRVKTIEYWAERDKKDVLLAGESVGITVEDEFFNKRGEIIAFSEEKPLISDAFRANLFWMGKNELVKGKKYKLKLATAETECELESIIRVIDASTLDSSSEATERIVKNDVAEVVFITKDTLAFDRFSDCNATGRFVIVDGYDVAGGGIIAGAEEKETGGGAVFKGGGLKARGDIFEEYYYSYDQFSVYKATTSTAVYTVGDAIPLEGESYAYPNYFDIIVLRDKVAVKIRDSKIFEIIPCSEYVYAGLPVVNGRGFEIKVRSQKDTEEFLKEYNLLDLPDTEFLNKWLNFETFRRITFRRYMEAEYMI